MRVKRHWHQVYHGASGRLPALAGLEFAGQMLGESLGGGASIRPSRPRADERPCSANAASVASLHVVW